MTKAPAGAVPRFRMVWVMASVTKSCRWVNACSRSEVPGISLQVGIRCRAEGAALHPDVVRPEGSGFAGEQALLDDRVHAPVAVHHLGDSVVHRHRLERDRLVLGKTAGGHEEVAHLAEGIPHGEIDRGLRIDVALRAR